MLIKTISFLKTYEHTYYDWFEIKSRGHFLLVRILLQVFSMFYNHK